MASLRTKILELGFQQLMRDGEAPLPFEDMSDDAVRMCAEFIATHREQITLPTSVWPESCFHLFLELYCLIDHLRKHSVLEIIDGLSPVVIQTIKKLKWAEFGGSWFHSLETLIADNLQYNNEHLFKLWDRENELKIENRAVCDRLVIFRKQRDAFTGERVKILRYRVKWFEGQEKLINSELADIMERMNAINHARNSLNFFYPA